MSDALERLEKAAELRAPGFLDDMLPGETLEDRPCWQDICALARELREAREDTARLDWLLSNPSVEIVIWGTDESGFNSRKRELKDHAAIDAERKA